MTEEEWRTVADPIVLLTACNDGHHTHSDKLSARKLRLFACACGRRVAPFLAEYDCLTLIRKAEEVADSTGSPLIPKAVIALQKYHTDTADPHTHEAANTLQSLVWQDPYRAAEHAACGAAAIVFSREVIRRLTPKMAQDSPANPELCQILRDIFGNPFRPAPFSPSWRTDTAVTLARQMHDSRDFGAMPILADALQDAGCEHEDILSHCRGEGPHVRGCWVVDLVLGKV